MTTLTTAPPPAPAPAPHPAKRSHAAALSLRKKARQSRALVLPALFFSIVLTQIPFLVTISSRS